MLSGELPIFVNMLLLLIGLAIITKGADKLVDSAVVIAERTGVDKVIIGATIVSLGTTLPEFTVTVLGSLTGRSQVGVGNAIGSTICNIGLILATCLLIRPISVDRKLYWQQGAIMVLAGVLVMLLSIDGYLGRWDALILIVGLGGYVYFSLRRARVARQNARGSIADVEQTVETLSAPAYRLKRVAVWFVVGAVGVVVGAALTVPNAVIVARWLGIPELIIGLTVVALGTSLPEYVTGLTATSKGHGEIIVGNIIGANVLDILWVLGAGALASVIPLERQTKVLDYPVMLVMMALLVIFGASGKQLARWQGGVLLSLYGVYLALMFLLFA